MRYVSSFCCLHRTGWFRRFLVANTFLLGAGETYRAPLRLPTPVYRTRGFTMV